MKTYKAAFSLASLLALALSACAGSDTDTGRPPTGATVGSEAEAVSSLSSSLIQIVGKLSYGQTADSIKYSNPLKYRALKWSGKKGDNVDVWVRSADGDAMAWLLDSHYDVLEKNDNAAVGETDSHIVHKLGSAGTYYIAFREYSLADATFTVTLGLSGVTADYSACHADSDCEAVPQVACCGHGYKFAVNKTEAAAYSSSLVCIDPVICPLFLILDSRVAECNTTSGQCEMVLPTAISCGGSVPNPHACPTGYTCKASPTTTTPGICVAH